jgi:hypothetical protein
MTKIWGVDVEHVLQQYFNTNNQLIYDDKMKMRVVGHFNAVCGQFENHESMCELIRALKSFYTTSDWYLFGTRVNSSGYPVLFDSPQLASCLDNVESIQTIIVRKL